VQLEDELNTATTLLPRTNAVMMLQLAIGDVAASREGGEHLGGGRLQSDFEQNPSYLTPAALHKVQAQWKP
jgi:hypothetical protein